MSDSHDAALARAALDRPLFGGKAIRDLPLGESVVLEAGERRPAEWDLPPLLSAEDTIVREFDPAAFRKARLG